MAASFMQRKIIKCGPQLLTSRFVSKLCCRIPSCLQLTCSFKFHCWIFDVFTGRSCRMFYWTSSFIQTCKTSTTTSLSEWYGQIVSTKRVILSTTSCKIHSHRSFNLFAVIWEHGIPIRHQKMLPPKFMTCWKMDLLVTRNHSIATKNSHFSRCAQRILVGRCPAHFCMKWIPSVNRLPFTEQLKRKMF